MKPIKLGLRIWFVITSVISFLAGWVLLAHAGKPAPLFQSDPSSNASNSSQLAPLPTLPPIPSLNDLSSGSSSLQSLPSLPSISSGTAGGSTSGGGFSSFFRSRGS